MTHSPVRTILIPAVLTAGTVFGLLTVTVVNSKALPLSADLPQYALREQQRAVAIRNVGYCILVSAMSGLAVAAGIRRMHAINQQAQNKQAEVSDFISEFLSTRPDEEAV